MLKLIFVTVASLLIQSCVVGPDYKKPTVAIPPHYKEVSRDWKMATPQDEIKRGEWWKIFNEPELDALENELNKANQNILAAEANFRQASQFIKQARSKYWPTLSGLAAYWYGTEISQRFPPFYNYTAKTNNEALLLTAAWEPDIWGKVRRTVESKTAEAQATAAQLAAIKLSSQASLAQYYFELRAVDSDQQALDALVVSFRELLKIIQDASKYGYVAQIDAIQAESQ